MDDKFATAKWANRMLRPLTSLHHRLGKYRELQSIDSTQRNAGRANLKAGNTTSRPPTKRAAGGVGEGFPPESDLGDDDHDPAWVPGESEKRRVKHRYAARGERLGRRARIKPILCSPDAVKILPGAIEIATPLITGKSTSSYVATGRQSEETRGGNTSEIDPQSPARKSKTGRAPRQSRFPQPDTQWRASLESAMDANYVDIVQRLDVLLLRFLEKTRLPDSPNPRSTSTSRSLLLTVMRRLPEFIVEEQRLQDELDDEDDIDMVDAYFTELESAYGSTAKGWQPLREAVRSQGIFLVCDMLQNSWITSYTASTLINRCIDAGENDAVETLLAAQLKKLEHYNPPDSFDPWRHAGSVRDPVRLLHKYWARSSHHTYVYEQLKHLLNRRVLPAEWMVTTPWKTCVVAATNSMSSGDHEFAAGTEFIEAVLNAATGVPWSLETGPVRRPILNGTQPEQVRCPIYVQDALSNLVSSLVVALCGMCFVRIEQVTSLEDGSCTRVANILSSLALMTARGLSTGQVPGEHEVADAQSLRRGYVLLGYCLQKCRQDPKFKDRESIKSVLNEDCEPFFALLEGKSDIVKELSVMVGQVVRCCERGEGAQCRRARRLCTQLLGSEKLGMTNLTLFLGKVAVEVALDFAQYSQDAEDHAYAGEIQDTVRALRARLSRGRGTTLNTTKKNHGDVPMQSFRWEEGIGEWIAKTPLDRSKGAAGSRLSTRPVVEIIQGSSPSSGSGDSGLESPSSALSIASTATSLSLKRALRDNADEEPCHNVKRVRGGYTKGRQSVRMAVQQQRIINDTEDEGESWESEDVDEPSSSSDSEDELSYETGYSSQSRTESRMANKATVQRLPRSNRPEFEVVIYNNSTVSPVASAHSAYSSPPANRRRRGRPSKRDSRRVSEQSVVKPRRSLRHSLVIPCSEDEESDDELSFLH